MTTKDEKRWLQEKYFGWSLGVIGTLLVALAGMQYSQLVKVDDRLGVVSDSLLQYVKEFTKQLEDVRYNQLAGGMATIKELEQLKSTDSLLKKEVEDLKESLKLLKEQKK